PTSASTARAVCSFCRTASAVSACAPGGGSNRPWYSAKAARISAAITGASASAASRSTHSIMARRSLLRDVSPGSSPFPAPAAPSGIRGDFRPAATRVPGIRVCEHLPRLAGVMDKVCLLRSLTHRMNVHGPACSEVFSGREFFGPPTTDQARPEDWPSLSSLVTRYGQSQGGLPPSVVLPWYLQFTGQDKRIAGQTGGRMGERYNAFLLRGDLGRADFEIEGLRPAADVPLDRVHRRRGLLEQLESPLPLRPAV